MLIMQSKYKRGVLSFLFQILNAKQVDNFVFNHENEVCNMKLTSEKQENCLTN